MKRDVQLYIAGRQVDLGDDSWILFNWSREVLGNPTSIVNGGSHQVTLPGTPRNNSVFGAVWRLDRRTLTGGYDGTRFDPTRKTPFTIFAGDGTVLESGYVRLDNVATSGRVQSYTVTFYGGLGSFFYSLAYDEQGNARTLADLTWKDATGADVPDFLIQPLPQYVDEAWNVLRDGYDPDEGYFVTWWNVLNFAPAYNGIPADFDASHAIMRGYEQDVNGYGNLPAVVTPADTHVRPPVEDTYTYKAGTDCALVSFTNAHTEWEMGDLRWYLQRPVVSVKAFIAAIADPRNNGGYTVNLDPAFFRSDNPYYEDGWWTLPLIATDDRASVNCLANCMKASKSPMSYLIDFAKTYGLLFLWDGGSREVSIVTRATFYAEKAHDVLDLTDRIDRSQDIAQDPVFADSMWYQLGDGGKGEFVEQYALDYGRGFAVQIINTGYEFDAGTRVLTDGRVFKDAAEVLESSRMFAASYYLGHGTRRYFILPKWESVTYELWCENDSKSFEMECDTEIYAYDNPDYPFADWFPKVQLHGADNKANDGADVLLFFAGTNDTPIYDSQWNMRRVYYLTADSAYMQDLAGGPCWDLTMTGILRTNLPSFRRNVVDGRIITQSYEWGVPAARPVPDIAHPVGSASTIYDLWWKDYLTDLYAADTRVMTCMVDLRGLLVGQPLLRRFFWYQGAQWVLNAIRNHSVTTDDLTECEFIKVGDKDAYIYGPGNDPTMYLKIRPNSNSFTFLPQGETIRIQVRSSSAWTLTPPGVAYVTLSANSGSAGLTDLDVTLTPNTSGARRNASITITNTEGITRTFTVIQDAAGTGDISISPSVLNIPATGTSTGGASRGRGARVVASGDWAVDSSTIPAWLTPAGGGDVIKGVVGLTIKAPANSGAQRTALLKVYLVDDPAIFATLNIEQAEGTGGSLTITGADGADFAQVSNTGTTLTLTVHSSGPWTITGVPSFVTGVAVNQTGVDGDTLTVTVPASSASREGAITAQLTGGSVTATFMIYQTAPVDTDSIQLTRRDNALYNDVVIGTGTEYEGFDVKASGPWTAVSDSAWLTPYGSAWSGSGNGTYWFEAAAGGPRTGTITATLTGTGKTAKFYVYQGTSGSFTLNFNKTRITAASQTVYLNIRTTGSWTITGYSAALTPQVTSGSGDAEIACTVSANTGLERNLYATVASLGTTLTANITQDAPSGGNYLIISPNGSASAAATDTQLDIAVSSDTSWRVSCDTVGVSLSRSTGTGSMTVSAYFERNTGASTKTFTLTFQTTSGTAVTRTLVVTQAAASAASLTVSPMSLEFSGAGQTKTVTVDSSAAWMASKSHSWITVASSGPSGSAQTVSISVSRNTGAGTRTGTVSFSSGGITRTVTITQPTDAELSVSAAAVSLGDAANSTGTTTVYASGLWDIDEYSDIPIWLNVSYPSHAGSQAGEVMTFTAASANTTGSPRSTTLTLKLMDNPEVTATVTITQASGDTLYIGPTAVTVKNWAGTGYIQVTSNTSWHITSIDAAWLTILEQSGTGNKSILYSYPANDVVEERRARVTFETLDGSKSSMFTLIQQAATAPIIIEPDEPLHFYSTNEGLDHDVLELTRVVTCNGAWTSEVSDAWLAVSPDHGAANVPVTVTFNARGTLSDRLNATWTINCGSDTKTLSAQYLPAPTPDE